MGPKRAVPPKPLAAVAPSSSTEEYGDTSSSDSTTSHEQEVADEEREEKKSESSEEESESESLEEEWAAAAAAEEVEEEEEDEGEAEPDLQPSSGRVDPPVTAAKNHPQSNKPLARGRKRASSEIGKSLSPGVQPEGEKTSRHSESREPKAKGIRRVWAPSDEVLILVALAQHRRQHGELPAPGDRDFFELLRERLKDNRCDHSDIKDKVRSLLRRYTSRVVLTTDHDRRLHNLSKDVWGDLSVIATATGSINGNKQANGVIATGSTNGNKQAGGLSDTKTFKEMCEIYPLLAQEVKLLAEAQPGLENSFTRLDAKRALDIEKKLERVKYVKLKIEARMVVEVHAPKAKISKKLVSLLAKVSKNA